MTVAITANRALPTRARQRGAALLLAMLVLTLVATLAANMVWLQWRAVQVESAERARTQAAWILNGALDWARLILREDARNGGADHLGEPWAVPLAEARLSTFLAADRDNTADSGPEAFLSGYIVDAQSRYNLRNLQQQDAKLAALELSSLKLICESLGLGASTGDSLAGTLLAAWAGTEAASRPVAAQSTAQLAWLGFDAATVARLSTRLQILPVATPVNLNTAPREVIAAVVEGMDLASADRLIQTRQRSPFQSLVEARSHLPSGLTLDPRRVGVTSAYFEVGGRFRLDQRALEETSIIQRRSTDDMVAIRRERRSTHTELK